jgi:hypothetical protein
MITNPIILCSIEYKYSANDPCQLYAVQVGNAPLPPNDVSLRAAPYFHRRKGAGIPMIAVMSASSEFPQPSPSAAYSAEAKSGKANAATLRRNVAAESAEAA